MLLHNVIQDSVGWEAYDGVPGFGTGQQGEIDDLNKALTVGSEINPPGSVVAGDGFAMRVESLHQTLINTSYKYQHVVAWRNWPKVAAWNTVEEHNVLSSYGQNPDAAWIAEIDLPEEEDSSYERKHSVVKFVGTVGRVSLISTLVRAAHGNLIAQETVNKTMHLLRVIERALFYGDSSLSALQFDGLEKLILDNAPAANIVDMRGSPLGEDPLIDGAMTVADGPNYGIPTDVYLNLRTKSDVVKGFFPRSRFDVFQATRDGMVGLDIRGIDTPAGPVRFNPDVFINDHGGPTGTRGNAAKVPAAPAAGTVTTPADGSSQFAAADAGDYFYTAQAVNRYGRSPNVDVVAGPTAVTVAAADKTTFTLTPGSAITPDWYEIFRTKVDGASGTERLILRVPNAAGTGAQTIDDFNAILPNTTSAFLIQQDEQNLDIKQLAPMIKIGLGTTDTSIRWMQLCFLVLRLLSPGKNVLYRNIGRATGFVGTP